jgi:hypothetical protein
MATGKKYFKDYINLNFSVFKFNTKKSANIKLDFNKWKIRLSDIVIKIFEYSFQLKDSSLSDDSAYLEESLFEGKTRKYDNLYYIYNTTKENNLLIITYDEYISIINYCNTNEKELEELENIIIFDSYNNILYNKSLKKLTIPDYIKLLFLKVNYSIFEKFHILKTIKDIPDIIYKLQFLEDLFMKKYDFNYNNITNLNNDSYKIYKNWESIFNLPSVEKQSFIKNYISDIYKCIYEQETVITDIEETIEIYTPRMPNKISIFDYGKSYSNTEKNILNIKINI